MKYLCSENYWSIRFVYSYIFKIATDKCANVLILHRFLKLIVSMHHIVICFLSVNLICYLFLIPPNVTQFIHTLNKYILLVLMNHLCHPLTKFIIAKFSQSSIYYEPVFGCRLKSKTRWHEASRRDCTTRLRGKTCSNGAKT